jgi:Domain of unknown function (DUF4252)
MKYNCTFLATVFLASCPFWATAQSSLLQDPAYLPIDKVLDLKIAKPEVSVNLPRFLLVDAVSELDLGTNSPFAAAGVSLQELVKDIKLIRFLVISTDEKSKAHVDQAVATLHKQLETNWVSVFSVPEEDVGVYAMSDPSGESVGGVAVLIHSDDETIIGNIVGRISIGKLLKVATKMKGENGSSMIPKNLIEKLVKISSSGEAGKDSKEGPKTKDKAP